MDKLSIAGLVVALFAIYLGFSIEGGAIATLFELPAFIIVFGGTVGAVLLQSSKQQFSHAISLLGWVIHPPKFDIEQGIDDVVTWAQQARESGYLVLENVAMDVEDRFVNKGLNFLADGVETEQLITSIELDIELYRDHSLRSAKIFESMGGYSPTIGILGAVLGLIQAMGNLSDPDMLGQGISTAFVATIYGVGFANLIYIPIANKIRAIVHQQTMYREMMAQGLIAISQGENPHAIENRLSAFRLQE
ncbi:flagellar motor protein [Thalassotalea euphylliae]|uniref:Flagellar motor protein n=1 Tax=Thalassotalea euphylliae TaxID=1655234 RepID=A0A3E0TNT5_9GAMM|nr:flagellar motor protein [Thalassotalea euphylliae]REL26093.1 flagellar motor protein [Thalassotalea euphylliae]